MTYEGRRRQTVPYQYQGKDLRDLENLLKKQHTEAKAAQSKAKAMASRHNANKAIEDGIRATQSRMGRAIDVTGERIHRGIAAANVRELLKTSYQKGDAARAASDRTRLFAAKHPPQFFESFDEPGILEGGLKRNQAWVGSRAEAMVRRDVYTGVTAGRRGKGIAAGFSGIGPVEKRVDYRKVAKYGPEIAIEPGLAQNRLGLHLINVEALKQAKRDLAQGVIGKEAGDIVGTLRGRLKGSAALLRGVSPREKLRQAVQMGYKRVFNEANLGGHAFQEQWFINPKAVNKIPPNVLRSLAAARGIKIDEAFYRGEHTSTVRKGAKTFGRGYKKFTRAEYPQLHAFRDVLSAEKDLIPLSKLELRALPRGKWSRLPYMSAKITAGVGVSQVRKGIPNLRKMASIRGGADITHEISSQVMHYRSFLETLPSEHDIAIGHGRHLGPEQLQRVLKSSKADRSLSVVKYMESVRRGGPEGIMARLAQRAGEKGTLSLAGLGKVQPRINLAIYRSRSPSKRMFMTKGVLPNLPQELDPTLIRAWGGYNTQRGMQAYKDLGEGVPLTEHVVIGGVVEITSISNIPRLIANLPKITKDVLGLLSIGLYQATLEVFARNGIAPPWQRSARRTQGRKGFDKPMFETGQLVDSLTIREPEGGAAKYGTEGPGGDKFEADLGWFDDLHPAHGGGSVSMAALAFVNEFGTIGVAPRTFESAAHGDKYTGGGAIPSRPWLTQAVDVFAPMLLEQASLHISDMVMSYNLPSIVKYTANPDNYLESGLQEAGNSPLVGVPPGLLGPMSSYGSRGIGSSASLSVTDLETYGRPPAFENVQPSDYAGET